MNYDFQMDGLLRDQQPVYSYQVASTIALAEAALDEGAGVGHAAALAGYSVIWRRTARDARIANAGGSIDWSLDGDIAASVVAELDGKPGRARFPPVDNEWGRLDYASGNVIGSRTDPVELVRRTGNASCQPAARRLLHERDRSDLQQLTKVHEVLDLHRAR